MLEGVFEDDYGRWPAGAYIRNPPGSEHTPGSTPGCTILVKLCQFDPDDRAFVHAHLDRLGAVADRDRDGVHVSPLYRDAREEVRAERWAPGARVALDASGGAEVFVLAGGFRGSRRRVPEALVAARAGGHAPPDAGGTRRRARLGQDRTPDGPAGRGARSFVPGRPRPALTEQHPSLRVVRRRRAPVLLAQIHARPGPPVGP